MRQSAFVKNPADLRPRMDSWNFRTRELSFPGTKVLWNFCPLELSFPGTFVPRNFRPMTVIITELIILRQCLMFSEKSSTFVSLTRCI